MNVDSISLKFLLESLQSSACKALLQQFLWDKAILEVEVEEYFVVMCFILATLMQLFAAKFAVTVFTYHKNGDKLLVLLTRVNPEITIYLYVKTQFTDWYFWM